MGAAARRIDELNAALRPAHSRIVAFGATVRTVEGTAALRQLARLEPTADDPGQVDRGGTDLAAALEAAGGELAAGHLPRIVLFSDGRPTAGDVRASIARLASERIPVSVEPLAVRSLGDTWVASIELPDRIAAGTSFPVTVSIGSQREGTAGVGGRFGPPVVARPPGTLSLGGMVVSVQPARDIPHVPL